MRAAAVGSEQGSNTQKKVVYVRPPEPLPNQPRQPRRQYPPAHAGAMTWSADGATGGGDKAEGNGPDASIAALVNDASAAWETEKAVASVRGGRGGGRGGRGARGGGRGGRGAPAAAPAAPPPADDPFAARDRRVLGLPRQEGWRCAKCDAANAVARVSCVACGDVR